MSDGETAPASATLSHVPAGGTSADTAQSPGMARRAAIAGPLVGSSALWMGENRMAPGARSGDHHHGRSETGIYVVAGHPVFVCAEDGGERRIETGPGDYVYVPPWVPHREENPGAEDAVVVLARSTQEAIVVPVEGGLAATS